MQYFAAFFLLTVLALPGVLPAQDAPEAAARARLIITITGFENTDGQVRVYLFNSPDGFPSKPAKALTVRKEKLSGTTHEVQIADLPYGAYAVAAHHDENGNDKMDSNWMHIPKEATGASNSARGTFGPPKFKKAAFEIAQDTVRIEILVK